MKIHVYALLFFINPLFAYSQNQERVLKVADRNLAVCMTTFKRDSGSHFRIVTTGFILSGKYFVTVSHYQSFPQSRVVSKCIFYNPHSDNFGNEVYDSVFVDLNYKSKKGQYDFSKHKFDSTNHCTDIYVYGLSKNINMPPLKFSQRSISLNDTLYSYGTYFNTTYRVVVRKYSISNFVFVHQEMPNQECSFIAFLGETKYGFSGSPIYNQRGEVMGIIQYGWDIMPKEYIDTLFFSDKINADTYRKIVFGYEKGLNLCTAMDIKYAIRKYLKGYLK